jgi:sec-independent protein translocase protein TatB
MLMVAGVALVFVGPERLPEMLRFLGRSYGKLRAMTYDIRREFTIEVDKAVAEERARVMQERREEMRRRLEEERRKRTEEAGEQFQEEPAHVPFGMEPQTTLSQAEPSTHNRSTDETDPS